MLRRVIFLGAVLLTVLTTTGMARAHGGPITIEVQGDGGQGVTAAATYVRDHHPVPVEMDLAFTAIDATGKAVGPIKMKASNEGRGFYLSTKELPVGKWTVTMTATFPEKVTKTAPVNSAILPPQQPEAPATQTLPTMAIVAGSAAAIAIIAAMAFFGAVLIRRRRTMA